jgi:hypothetical protein
MVMPRKTSSDISRCEAAMLIKYSYNYYFHFQQVIPPAEALAVGNGKSYGLTLTVR